MKSAHRRPPKQITLEIGRGTLGGRIIRCPDQADLRPTLGRVREAVFSMLAGYAQSHGFIDLCAGSGIMGFEAGSMAFHPLVLLEPDVVAFRALEENVTKLAVNASVVRGSAWHLAGYGLSPGSYVIYSDPPFRETRFHEHMLTYLSELEIIAPGSIYVAEWERSGTEAYGQFQVMKQKRYGRIHITVLEKN